MRRWLFRRLHRDQDGGPLALADLQARRRGQSSMGCRRRWNQDGTQDWPRMVVGGREGMGRMGIGGNGFLCVLYNRVVRESWVVVYFPPFLCYRLVERLGFCSWPCRIRIGESRAVTLINDFVLENGVSNTYPALFACLFCARSLSPHRNWFFGDILVEIGYKVLYSSSCLGLAI